MMVEVIQLPPDTARFLNDARGLLSVYTPRNIDGKYSSSIDKYKKLYQHGLDNLLSVDVAA